MNGKTAKLLRRCGGDYRGAKRAWTLTPWRFRAALRGDALRVAAAHRAAQAARGGEQ